MSEDTFFPGTPRPVGEQPYNASNPTDVVSAQELDKYRQDRAAEDLVVVLNSPTGRAVLWRVLGFFHLNGVADSLDHADLAAMHGLHHAGNRIKGIIEGIDPTAYHKMALEAGERERSIEFAFKAKRDAAKKPSAQPPA